MSVRTPWDAPLPPDARVETRVLRFPKRDHPRVVVAVYNPLAVGYKWIHLTRPVAYHSGDGMPAWVYRAVRTCRAALAAGSVTATELAAVAERAHAGRGVRR